MATCTSSLPQTEPLVRSVLTHRTRWFDRAKVAFDMALASVALVLTGPLILFCMAWIRVVSSGPAIFRQTRLGASGKPFRMYKLRTMHANAEARTGPVLAAADDRRIIPSCRWMRLSHIDELPQLINVLRGEMSLVGPRPERPEIAERIYAYLPEFRYRTQVRPGITGLAQVCNGYDTCQDAVRHKLGYDMRYIRQRGWGMDLWILIRTLSKLHDSTAR